MKLKTANLPKIKTQYILKIA